MQFLILLFAVAPIYAAGDAFGDLLGQEFQYSAIDHVREKRQSSNYRSLNQAPPYLHELLQAQDFRAPLVPIPQQPVPKLGPAQPIQPQQVSQKEISQYRPQVTFASGTQQPDYRALSQGNPGQFKKPIIPQQPQYRPLPQANVQPNYNAQQPQYSSKLPPHIQQLLQYQNNLSNAIPGRA